MNELRFALLLSGDLCDTDIDECQSSPCQSGGTCVNLINGFRCNCPRGYFGYTCASDVDECRSSPCLNGGTCNDGINR